MSCTRPITAYADQITALMPRGRVWPEAGGPVWAALMRALAPELARLDQRACDLIEEADPRTCRETLTDWERVLGLPDPCSPGDATFEERRRAVITKLRMEGGASRQYFIDLAAALGFAISITEHQPLICGRYRCGHQAERRPVGSPLMRFIWRVSIAGRRLRWFRCGDGSRTGTDPHVRIQFADELECIFEALKPAHTRIVFDYVGGPSTGDFSADFSADFLGGGGAAAPGAGDFSADFNDDFGG